MIDEKKLLKALQGFHEREEEYKSVFDEQGIYYEPQTGLIDEIIKYVQKMPKVAEWIPCSERLPEEGGIYIVDDRAFNSPWIHTAGFEVSSQAWCENHGVYYDDKYGRYEDGRITAWQPLPEPWEGEE